MVSLNAHLQPGGFLCGVVPTLADVFVWVTSLFAEVWGFDLGRWPNVAALAAHLRGLPGFARPSTSCPCRTHYFNSHVGQGLSKYESEVQRIDARREQTWLSQLRVE
jgi:hypothetical protein